MLVLSRHESEAVIMCVETSPDVYELHAIVYNVESRGSRARLGFYCPKAIRVFRQELTEFDGLTFQDLCKVPIGTRVRLKEKQVA